MYPSVARGISAPILAILLIQICQLFARSWLQIRLQASGYAPQLASELSYLLSIPLLLALLGPIVWQHREFLAKQLDTRSITLATLGATIAIGLLLRLAYWAQLIGFVALGLYTDDGGVTGPLFSFACPPLPAVLRYLLVMALLVPLLEEIINRGFFLHGLLARGRAVAIIGSSVLFAAFHSPAGMPAAFVSGIVFAAMALRAQSLWPGIVAHATFNALIAFDWLCLNGQWNPDLADGPNLAIGMASLLACCGALALALWVACKALAPKPDTSAPPR